MPLTQQCDLRQPAAPGSRRRAYPADHAARVHGPLKTPASKGEVILAPTMAKLLRERWVASPTSSNTHSSSATPRAATSTTATSAHTSAPPSTAPGPTAPGRLSLHSLRRGYASLLISRGLNVVFVSRQLGHANPNVTLEVHAHLFESANHDSAARDALEASYGGLASLNA